MESKSIQSLLKPALKVAGLFGTVGGFIGDVLSPLGPVLMYLLYLSIFTLIISLIAMFVTKDKKKELFKSITITSVLFSVMFGVFSQLNEDNENGFLSENVEFISQFQSNLNLIDEKLDKISDQIEVVDEKIDEGFKNLSEEIKNSNPIKNPKTPKDFILNAYLYMDGGDLKKSEESFISFFNLKEKFYIDALYDFVSVMRNNNGFNYVKTYFETNAYEDEVFKLFKLLNSKNSYDLELLEKIKTSNLNQNLIDFAVVLITNDSDFYMRVISADASQNYSFPINNIESIIRLREKGIKELDNLILSKSKINDLLSSAGNSNMNGGKSLMEFYFSTIDLTINSFLSSDTMRSISEANDRTKMAFIQLVSGSDNRVTIPDDEKVEIGKMMDYFVEVEGEKYYLGSALPSKETLKLYSTWRDAKLRLENL
jgi:hypothetical protein